MPNYFATNRSDRRLGAFPLSSMAFKLRKAFPGFSFKAADSLYPYSETYIPKPERGHVFAHGFAGDQELAMKNSTQGKRGICIEFVPPAGFKHTDFQRSFPGWRSPELKGVEKDMRRVAGVVYQFSTTGRHRLEIYSRHIPERREFLESFKRILIGFLNSGERRAST